MEEVRGNLAGTLELARARDVQGEGVPSPNGRGRPRQRRGESALANGQG